MLPTERDLSTLFVVHVCEGLVLWGLEKGN